MRTGQGSSGDITWRKEAKQDTSIGDLNGSKSSSSANDSSSQSQGVLSTYEKRLEELAEAMKDCIHQSAQPRFRFQGHHRQ